ARVVDDGSNGTVTPGAAGSLGTARTLASAAAGASGGVFKAGADLDLSVPAGASPGDYTATLTLTLSWITELLPGRRRKAGWEWSKHPHPARSKSTRSPTDEILP